MGEMRDSDWSRPKILRSDWLGLIGATMTTSNNSAQFLEHFFAATARLRRKNCIISRFVGAVNERRRILFPVSYLKFMRSSLLKLPMFGSSFPSVG